MLHFVNLIKLIKPPNLQICKQYYSIYYVHTRNIFILSFIISITNQFMGDASIHCNMARESSIPYVMAHSFCYLNGTYTIVNNVQYYHHYYKWISMILFLEAFAFYFPFYVWSNICYTYIESLTSDKSDNNFQLNETRCEFLLKEIKNSKFNIYYKHLFLELLFFINLISQFVLLHILLNFKFFTFDYNILFPYVTTCEIEGAGVSGNASQLKLLCHLPLNILYKKIFSIVFIWFWILIFSNLCYFIYQIQTLIKNKKCWTCNQWMLYKIIIWNTIGENKKFINNKMKNVCTNNELSMVNI